jgi:hypothetical protein
MYFCTPPVLRDRPLDPYKISLLYGVAHHLSKLTHVSFFALMFYQVNVAFTIVLVQMDGPLQASHRNFPAMLLDLIVQGNGTVPTKFTRRAGCLDQSPAFIQICSDM